MSSTSSSSPSSIEGIGGRFFGSNGFWEFKDNFLSRIEAALQSTQESPARKMKDRSVFGQPEVKIPINTACHPGRLLRELSRESLETLDSGHSLGSCRISSADLKHLESYDTLKPYRYRNYSGDGNGGSDSAGIGSSIESSDVEDGNDEIAQDEDEDTSRCESRASMTSSSSDDSQIAMRNRETKEFMRDFVKGIFDNGYDCDFNYD
jgi:hypothetical protein